MITYSKFYLVYIVYLEQFVVFVICGSLVGAVRLKDFLRAPPAVSSPVCSAHYFNMAEAGLALVPVGDTGSILFSMRKQTRYFAGASCDSKDGAGDGNRWWYINSNALKWATSQ